jgi:hypothetical protein
MAFLSPIETRQRLRALCAEVGFDFDSAGASVVARLQLLAEHTETVSDCEQMVARARQVFRYYETTKPGQAFSEGEQRIVVLGCLFSDIGKTGPVSADSNGQRLILEMFAVEGVRDETQGISQFFRTHFPADSDERLRRFAALGLDPRMSIREFWNLHSAWTLQIVEAGGVPPEAIPAAASHHLLDDINPDAIVASDRRFTRPFGDNPSFDRAEKLIILLDKYDALRRRGRRTHEHAIAWLRERVDHHVRFRSDTEFLTLLADLDIVLRP